MTKEELKQEAEECIHNALFWLKLPISKENVEQGGSYILKLLEPREKRIEELEKENAELKELIKNIVRVTWGEGWNYSLDWKVKAEQFLKDCDINNAIQQANKGLDFDKIADEMEQDLKDSEVEK